jgi:Tfp pilus assembly protein PilW
MADPVASIGSTRLGRAIGRTPRPGWVERGTTLLELMVAVSLVAVLLAGLLLVWAQGVKLYFQGSEMADLQQEARIAHQRMTNELRLAGMNPCNGTLTDDAVASGTSSSAIVVEYFALKDGSGNNTQKGTVDCVTDGPSIVHWRVTYDTSSQALRRTQENLTASPATSSGALPLTDQKLGTVTLQYLQCDGTAAQVDTQPHRHLIARVTVTVGASETYSGGTLARQLVSTVRVRNTACTGVIF